MSATYCLKSPCADAPLEELADRLRDHVGHDPLSRVWLARLLELLVPDARG